MTPPNQPLDALAEELEKAAKKSVDVFFENRSENTVAVFSARNILSLLAERKRDKAVIETLEDAVTVIAVRAERPSGALEIIKNVCGISLARVAKIRGGGE